jgi:hypothetical protein
MVETGAARPMLEEAIMKLHGIRGRVCCGVIAIATTVALAACGRATDTEMQWAQAALARNPDLEVVAVDAGKRIFTVRDTANDRLYTVALADIVAGPAELLRDRDGQKLANESPASTPAPADADTASAVPATPTPTPTESHPEGSTATPADATAATPAPASQAAAEPTSRQPGYTIERSGGRVRVSGPGFSIVSADSSKGEVELASKPAAHDAPIICEGARMMHLDDRTLNVAGDAIIVRDGCDLYLTNSHVSATGVAVTATRAKVHIANSTVQGGARSLELSDGGEAFLRDSTLDGVAQRLGSAQLHDLGGNRWE